jgi:uncharacterized membrane protein
MIDAFLHWLGYGLCHQLPARSFFAGGHQLPVCARDTGIYIGFVISLAIVAVLDRGRHRSEMPRLWVLAVGALLVGFMAWDGVTSYAGWRTTTNELRLATGLACGWALPLVCAPLLNSGLWRRISPERVLGSTWESVVWLALLPVSFAAIYWGGPLLGTAYALGTAVAILVTFTAVNLIVVLLAPIFERRATRLRDAWLPILIAFAVTLIEVEATGLLRAFLLSLVATR